MTWLKADFHMHTRDCVYDGVKHSTCQLIDRAAKLQFKVLAVTNHCYVIYSDCWREYAEERGILLLPGVEANIERRHVLIINADQDANRLRSFADLAAYRRSHNVLIIAPHPFYPGFICLRKKLLEHLELFDAVEYNSFYLKTWNPNLAAQKFAEEYHLPLLGGSDTHHLSQLGNTHSMIQSELSLDSIFQAVRAGKVRVVTQPMRTLSAVRLLTQLRIRQAPKDMRRVFFPGTLQCRYEPYVYTLPKGVAIKRAS
jgi:predicted metal-dependent phosphoesterase TrpH